MWAKKWLLGRDRYTHLNLLNFIRYYSPEDYKNYLRMSDENGQYLIPRNILVCREQKQVEVPQCWLVDIIRGQTTSLTIPNSAQFFPK